jgi:hypothetical protein
VGIFTLLVFLFSADLYVRRITPSVGDVRNWQKVSIQRGRDKEKENERAKSPPFESASKFN